MTRKFRFEKGKEEVITNQHVVLKEKHFLEWAVDYELLTTDYELTRTSSSHNPHSQSPVLA